MTNNILELRGKRFVQAARISGGGGPNMNSKSSVKIADISRLKRKLEDIKEYWETENRVFEGIIVSVYYNKIVAKSNRIGGLLKGKASNEAVVGAKFNHLKNKHIITYYILEQDLNKSIELLEKTNIILESKFKGEINKNTFDDKSIFSTLKFNNSFLSKSLFRQIVADLSYIEDFEVEHARIDITDSIVTIYDTEVETKKLLKEIGIDVLTSRIIDSNTVFLNENEMLILLEKAPYLVSMATTNLKDFDPLDFTKGSANSQITVPSPTIEPTIGVIDTLFDEDVYFNEWVEYHEVVDREIPRDPIAYRHGTAVTSIIVDGPKLNPWLDDGCGRFKVRHFGVAAGNKFSSFSIIKSIKEIIARNKDIKVWNISLGSNQEIDDNFISAEASILDKIQHEYDVIFIIAGTNKPNMNIERIGSPADSINGLVVNAVTSQGLSTNYSRRGIALSFFAKPDVSYYGGSTDQYMNVCEPLGMGKVAGTSYAAPWIARKMSYLIDILGLNRELAKALIIDAAKGWRDNIPPEEVSLYGHGTVPIRIEEIVNTNNDEIKFLVTDVSEKWNTYSYSFPVPLKEDKYPYIARATMCYFPSCNRSQGVDYTNTELNVIFGRIKDNGKFNDIKGDRQNEEDNEGYYLYESEARENFRKWDNVKYISETNKANKRLKKSYSNKNWGMEIKTNNRLHPEDGLGLRFGVVVTLKEINGINLIDEFIKNCNLNGWIVNELDVEVKTEINQILSEEIEFE